MLSFEICISDQKAEREGGLGYTVDRFGINELSQIKKLNILERTPPDSVS